MGKKKKKDGRGDEPSTSNKDTNEQQAQPIPQQVPPGPQQGRQGQQQAQPGPQPRGAEQRQPGPQQGQPGPQQGQRGPQQGQWGPQQGQPGLQQGQPTPQQVPPGPPPGQRGPQQGQPGPQQGQRGPQQGQRGPQQGQWGPQQGQPGLQQGQPTPQQVSPGPPPGQRGPQQQGQRGPQQGQRGPQQVRPDQQLGQLGQSSSQQVSSSVTTIAQQPRGAIERGTLGRPGVIEVNYLNIEMGNMPDVAYHYDVTITPDRPKKFLRPVFEQFNRQYLNGIWLAFDGKKNCYTSTRLQNESIEGEVQIDDSGSRKATFTVCIKETMDLEIDLSSLRRYFTERIFDKPMRALQCLEVILCNPCHSKGVRVGRSFFMQPKQKMDLDDGYELWLGLYQAAILGDRPFLNVDISHKSFPSPCYLLDYIKNNCRIESFNSPLDSRRIEDVQSFLKSLSIVYEPPPSFGSFPKTYKVHNITTESASQLTFMMNDQKMSVANYYKSKGYNLKYPNFNCLSVGSTVNVNYLPIELCKIPPGQATLGKDGQRQVQKMIRFAATSTDVRKQKIVDMLSYFQHNLDKHIQHFGLQIGSQFIDVPMRLMESPKLEYFNNELIKPFKGAWRMNNTTKYFAPKMLANGHKCAVIFSNRSRLAYNAVVRFTDMIKSTARALNVQLQNDVEIKDYANVGDVLNDLKKKDFDLVFVILPRFGTSYAQVKQEAELRIGLLTQCVTENTLERRCDPQTISNILLKVNHKLNGTNHKVRHENKINIDNVMFLGADVTHPLPDQKSIPSVVGVVASYDKLGACYNMQYRLQRPTCENIEDMESICKQHLEVYYKYQKKYPSHIIYYRDGVSDGQFPIVKRNELRDIRAACSKLKCNAMLTCIIVVKRHHTRFFPKGNNPRDKFNNVEPGTIVDRVIVHPNEVQFFMVSHQSIQGTAKPTRYNVIEDDAKMEINQLQALTFNLCHMFPRCNRIVSYPAPAYLAHLVAYRGRVYIEGVRNISEPEKEYKKRLVKTDFMQRNPMYFI